jgi:hypothetical protein
MQGSGASFSEDNGWLVSSSKQYVMFVVAAEGDRRGPQGCVALVPLSAKRASSRKRN